MPGSPADEVTNNTAGYLSSAVAGASRSHHSAEAPGSPAFSVGVVGGGSAGYLTALAFAARRPDIDVTVIESSRLPPIGVGEGTTPTMVPFLHGYLGLDIAEFVAEVEPTWKLGVRLDWGQPDGGAFAFPFAAPHLRDAYRHTGRIDDAGLSSMLMASCAGLHEMNSDLSYGSMTSTVPFAYHLDNRRFVTYLCKAAARRGVHHIDAHLAGATRSPDGSLATVTADDGRSFAFDLFIDCSGFASRLLGDELDVPFTSYASSFMTDAALVGAAPHLDSSEVAPYTGADTMDAGWCWSVPQIDDDRLGYVFSSSHLSPDHAEAELRRERPGIGEVRLVRFEPGRRERWWHHNVVAIGNSYGFLEPLQATALHMVVHEISVLISSLDSWQRDPDSVAGCNDHMASLWESTRSLLAMHYRWNQRRATPFWHDVRSSTDVGIVEPFVDDALAAGTFVSIASQAGLSMGAAHDLDLVMMGMQVANPVAVAANIDEAAWHAKTARVRQRASNALRAADSIRLARSRPDLFAPGEAPWFQMMVRALERPTITTASAATGLLVGSAY